VLLLGLKVLVFVLANNILVLDTALRRRNNDGTRCKMFACYEHQIKAEESQAS